LSPHRRRLLPLAALFCLGACDEPARPSQSIPGDAVRGRQVVAAVGCGACHEIPGVAGARGIVGPSLAGFSRRTMIAGIVPNRPGILAVWVRDAPRIAPDTAMPHLPLSRDDALDVTAFLYSLR
jgi:hypothetical protein